jgi:hypothetical protein
VRGDAGAENVENMASHAQISRGSEHARGGFKVVYMGEFTQGQRKGQKCVAKEFIDRATYEEAFFAVELDVVNRAVKTVKKFNAMRFVDKDISCNVPQVWTYVDCEMEGAMTLIDCYIENFEKFNSNSGWSGDGTPWHEVMQALSHFSYHSSGGFMVLCDLQGGVYSDGVVLTDPVVMSRTRQFGPTDLGAEGISTFFARHKCNKFCRASWAKPARPEVHFPLSVGTSMIHVTTVVGRNPMSRQF